MAEVSASPEKGRREAAAEVRPKPRRGKGAVPLFLSAIGNGIEGY